MPNDARWDAGGDGCCREFSGYDGAGGYGGVVADAHAVQHDDTGAEPGIVADCDAASLRARLLHDRHIQTLKAVISPSDEIAMACNENLVSHAQSSLTDESAVDGDVRCAADCDRAAFAGENGVAADDGIISDINGCFAIAFSIEHDVIVDDDAIAERDPVRMTDRNIPPDDDASAASLKEPPIGEAAQYQSGGAWNEPEEGRSKLIIEKGGKARSPDG